MITIQLDSTHLCFFRCLGQVDKHLAHLPVEDPHPAPVQGQRTVLSFKHLTNTPSYLFTLVLWKGDVWAVLGLESE